MTSLYIQISHIPNDLAAREEEFMNDIKKLFPKTSAGRRLVIEMRESRFYFSGPSSYLRLIVPIFTENSEYI